MSTAPLIAFWSVSKDSSSGEIVEMLSDGPSAIPCRPKKTGVVSQFAVPVGRAVAADAGSALMTRASRAAMARVGSTNLVRSCLIKLMVVPSSHV